MPHRATLWSCSVLLQCHTLSKHLFMALLGAGGCGGVGVLCIGLRRGHWLPPLNALPLHPSILEPHFDLEDEKDTMSYCLEQADACVSIDVFGGILEKKTGRNLPGLSALYLMKVFQADVSETSKGSTVLCLESTFISHTWQSNRHSAPKCLLTSTPSSLIHQGF